MKKERLKKFLLRITGRFEFYDRWYFEKEKKRISNFYLEKQLNEKDAKKKRFIRQDSSEEVGALDDRFRVLMTNRLLSQARRLSIPIPVIPYDEKTEQKKYWEFSMRIVDWYLSEAGVQMVRSLIRNEERERAELRNIKAGWIHPLTGAIGASIGLITILATVLKSC